MTNVFDNVKLAATQTTDNNDNFENPIDITDILLVCREYSKLGHQIQNQIEYITELGIDEAIKTNMVKTTSLPIIKYFLNRVSENPLFGDAAFQSNEMVSLIEIFEMKHPELFKSLTN